MSCIKKLVLSGLLLLPVIAYGQLSFTDQTDAAGIPVLRSESIAVGDYNNDGWPDAYVTFPAGPNQLLKNNGAGGFEDVAPQLGLDFGSTANTRVAAWGDFNNDGHLDLYVGSREAPNFLFFNNGDGSFTDRSSEAGIQQPSAPKSVNLLDYDNDGWLDIYVSNFGRQNVLLRNNGNGSFSDQTTAAGTTDTGTSMGVICFDYEQDGDQDMFLVKDANQPNLFYRNNGDGTFTNIAEAIGLNTQSFGMGADVADINGDGLLDIYVTNLDDNFLFIAQADGTFLETGTLAGVDDAGMGWGTVFLDLENDGWPDIYLANEYSFSPFENKIYQNEGDGTFEDVLEFESIANEFSSWGCVSIDQDMDGREDLLVANRNPSEHLQYFRNTSTVGNYFKLRLWGIESNRMAVGTRIRIEDDLGRIHYQEVNAGCSWQSQNGSILHFGLGAATEITNLTINWPSGQEQSFNGLLINEVYTVVEGQAATLGLTYEVATSVFNPEQALSIDFSLSPNPVVGTFVNLEFATSLDQKASLKVLNNQGQEVFGRSLSEQERIAGACQVSTVQLVPGLYWVEVSTVSERGVKKLLVK